MQPSKYRTVQMNLLPETVAKVDRLQKATSAGNRTAAVRIAIDVATMVIDEINAGNHVVLEDRKGDRQRIVIPGVSPGVPA